MKLGGRGNAGGDVWERRRVGVGELLFGGGGEMIAVLRGGGWGDLSFLIDGGGWGGRCGGGFGFG